MAIVKSVKIKTDAKTLNTLKIEEAPVIEDTISGAQMKESSTLRYSTTSDPANVRSDIHADTQFIVGYIPTIFGGTNCKRLVAAISDFYNKVTGSALQTTHISDGDLFLFFKVGYEWRVLLAVIRKMIRQYNMISSVNDAYGKKHFDAVFGDRSYAYIAANYNDIVRDAINLTNLINQRFPMPKGNNALQFEIDLISETFVDDPNGKGSLIDFKRIFKDTVHDDFGFNTYAGNPRESSHGWNFWIGLDRNGNSTIYTVPVNFSDKGWIGILKTIADNAIEETWYKDIMPYVTHMLDCGMVSDMAPLPEANVQGDWSPVYNPHVLAYIRNAKYCGELANELNGGNFNIFEHKDGYVYEGRATISFDPDHATYAGLHVLPLYASDIKKGPDLIRPTKLIGITDSNPENFLFNLEDYPSNPDTLKNVISGQYLVEMNNDFVLLDGVQAGINGTRVFPLISECSNIVLSNIYVATAGSTNLITYKSMNPTAIYTAVDDASNTIFVRSDCLLVKRSDVMTVIAEFLKTRMYNFVPNYTAYSAYSTFKSDSVINMDQFVGGSYITHDVDSLVYFPLQRLKMTLKEVAYHAWYDAAEVKVRSYK